MRTVNPYLLHDLMAPITGLADDDNAVILYRYVDQGNEDHYREIIRGLFVEYFSGFSNSKKEKTKLTLRYYLSKHDSDFERVFNACLPPFEPPYNPRDFFVWIWEELFGDECFKITDMHKYEITPNLHDQFI